MGKGSRCRTETRRMTQINAFVIISGINITTFQSGNSGLARPLLRVMHMWTIDVGKTSHENSQNLLYCKIQKIRPRNTRLSFPEAGRFAFSPVKMSKVRILKIGLI